MKLSEFCPVELPPADLPEHIFIGAGLRSEISDIVASHLDTPVQYIADENTLRASGFDRSISLLGAHPHADDETVNEVVKRLVDARGACALGSGTVNDLVKRASTLCNLPYVVFGTAASMNGYASGIAAIVSQGLKTTVPARPPRAIILDTEVLAAAPAVLTQAGLGDLMSKPVSDSDWFLADQLEGTGYSTLPSAIVDHAVQHAIEHAAGLKEQDEAAHGALGAALVLSGVAMVVAGSSSPASGGEHLLSHLWDMQNLSAGQPTRLHGAQVGVATCISAAIYQRLLRLRQPRFTTPDPWSIEAERISKAHGPLAKTIMEQAQRKHARAAARVAKLRDDWSVIRSQLEARRLPTPADVRRSLTAAGAASTLGELSIDRANAIDVLCNARDIRDRVTVLDVAYETGILPGAADDILREAGV
ncbi:MAG: iron-containing alcohol dehydrogenase [Myxococcota bacterium]|nr:iron-containing alcohol dehydrogenase [Myxococcota bacterium]